MREPAHFKNKYCKNFIQRKKKVYCEARVVISNIKNHIARIVNEWIIGIVMVDAVAQNKDFVWFWV